ncbi:UNVERIFIED_CONTAM: hypothetical protein Sindi_1716900, partial [Sesamum indicum]
LVEGHITSVVEDVSILIDVVDMKLDGMKTKVNLLKCVMDREDDRVPSSKAVRVPDAEKLPITTMYLTGDAELWWRMHFFDDASANCDKIET